MILLQIDWRHRPRELLSQIRYGAIRQVGRTLLGNTRLTLANGKRHVLAYVPRRDRKFLQRLTSWIEASLAQETTGWQDLCPHCYQPVAGRPRTCPACRGGIKSARTAGLLSLLFPGLGDLYLGHWKFAIFELGFTTLLWLAVMLPALTADAESRVTAAAILIAGAVLVMLVHIPDAVATWYIGRKGLYPERQ